MHLKKYQKILWYSMSKDIALGSEDIAFCQSIIRTKGNKITKFSFSRNVDF